MIKQVGAAIGFNSLSFAVKKYFEHQTRNLI
jgi:hypothetical protein